MQGMLRFFARGTACMPDPHGAEMTPQRRRCVGRAYVEVKEGVFAWAPTGKPEELPFHHDLVKACRDGDLWAADQATADACGVKFDPDFGGEIKPAAKSGGKGDV